MSAKTRLQKLESVKRDIETPVYRFTQEVRADGNRFYFIDSAEVDAAKYAKDHAEYMRLRTDSKMPNELIIHCNGESEPSGSVIIYATE